MKVDLTQLPEGALDPSPRAGDVYPAQGGRGTAAWIVLAVRGETVHMLGVDRNGEPCSTTSYGAHVLRERMRIGFCEAIAELTLIVRNVDISRSSRA